MKIILVFITILSFRNSLWAKADSVSDLDPNTQIGKETTTSVQSVIAKGYNGLGPFKPKKETNVKDGVTPFVDPFKEAHLKPDSQGSGGSSKDVSQ